MRIGVCYYPEHWPDTTWHTDARRMHDMGIRIVRIGEFAWSRLEPREDQWQFDWLQQAIDTLGDAGLDVVLGTPTATPPKWLIDRHPDILAVDADGKTRHFGSRRHYCFSSRTYREHCRRIVQQMAEHFGQHPAVRAWQTDNEYGCHNTILSYSAAAREGFRRWCSQRYASIDLLNQAWGNVFWSMEYQNFDQIDLPVLTVTEANPAHVLAFWRYSSDQVKTFNQLQVDILRRLSPGRDLIHNYMGNFVEFDHYPVADDLDVASWDNYPLGFLDRDTSGTEDQRRWYRTGHPDSSAFHHDLYRGVGRGRWWVMEQQPGPVNWAPHNPSPLDGMVRLWGWEAFAHGAEVISYFRWRQLPFGQEQLHSGLCLPNGEPDTGAREAEQLYHELSTLLPHIGADSAAPVALLFDYTGDRMQRILRIGGIDHDPFDYVKSVYSACRSLGVDVDIVPGTANFSDYRLILIVNQMVSDAALLHRLKQTDAHIVLFPGSGSRNADCRIVESLPPGVFRELIDVRITRGESLPEFIELAARSGHHVSQVRRWRERVESSLPARGKFDDGWGFHYSNGRVHYVNALLFDDDLREFLRARLLDAGVTTTECPVGLRLRRRGAVQFAFNFGPMVAEIPTTTELLLGTRLLPPGEVAAWRFDVHR